MSPITFRGEPNNTANLGFIEDYSTSLGDVMQAGFDDALATNPTKLWYESEKRFFIETHRGNMISKEEAEKRASEAGVKVHNIKDTGINDEVLGLLIERQYQAKKRAETISASKESWLLTKGAELTGGFGGSMLDPIGLAANFVPVVGEARYAKWLAQAAGPLERAGVRAAVGGAEGLVGAAILEPAVAGYAKQLGDDYTMANSLMNLAFGTAMGGGFHMGGGAISDALARKRSPEFASPKGEVAERLSEMPHEARVEMGTTAVAQLADDRPVEVHVIAERIGATREERTNVAKEIDPEAWDDGKLDYARQEKESAQAVIDDVQRQIDEIEPQYAEVVNRLQEIDAEIKAKPVEEMDPKRLMDLRSEEEVLAKKADQFEREMTAFETEQKKYADLFDHHDNAFREMNQRRRESYQKAGQQLDGVEEIRWKQVQDEKFKQEIIEQATREPKPQYIDQSVLDRMNEEVNNIPSPDRQIDEAKFQLEEGEMLLKEQLDQMGLERPDDLIKADENVKLAEEMNRASEALARCATRRG